MRVISKLNAFIMLLSLLIGVSGCEKDLDLAEPIEISGKAVVQEAKK